MHLPMGGWVVQDRPIFYQDIVHDPLPCTAHNPQGDKLKVGWQNSKEQNDCDFPPYCLIITMILSFRGASEMSSPVWPQARLPTLARVLGEMKGNQGQAAQLCTPLCQGERTLAPVGTTHVWQFWIWWYDLHSQTGKALDLSFKCHGHPAIFTHHFALLSWPWNMSIAWEHCSVVECMHWMHRCQVPSSASVIKPQIQTNKQECSI